MGRRLGIFIVVLVCVVSLVGLLIYQSMWVNKAIKLAGDQYDHRANTTLNAVSAEYARLYGNASLPEDSLALTAKVSINKGLLDSLLSVYFTANRVSEEYKYCIANTSDMPVYSSSGSKPAYYSIPLSHLLLKDSNAAGVNNLQLRLYFGDKKNYIFAEIWEWLLVYGVFIVIIIFSLIYLVNTVLKQKRNANEQADFIHTMIHELKTPVATIEMSCKVLKKAGISVTDFEKLRSYAGIVDEENNRIWACVDSLLQMLTVNKRSLSLRKELLDVNNVVKQAIESFSVATMARPVTFSMELDEEMPSILADKMHVRAVIDNIVENAIKYSSSAGNSNICIKTAQIRSNIIVIVEDNGKGIAKKDRRRIFKKFYRVSSERKKGIKGFGLGLYYVQQVVGAHGGKVYVRSKLNKGTQMGVLLPIE